MPIYMRYEGLDGQFGEADRFDFLQLTTEPTDAELTVPRTGKPSLIVKFDIGGPTGTPDQDDGLLLPAVQDDGLLLPAVQTDYDLLLPY